MKKMIQRRRTIQREVTNEETNREDGDPTKRRVVATKTHGSLCTNISLQMESLYTSKTSLSRFILTSTRNTLMTNLAGNIITPSPHVTNNKSFLIDLINN